MFKPTKSYYGEHPVNRNVLLHQVTTRWRVRQQNICSHYKLCCFAAFSFRLLHIMFLFLLKMNLTQMYLIDCSGKCDVLFNYTHYSKQKWMPLTKAGAQTLSWVLLTLLMLLPRRLEARLPPTRRPLTLQGHSLITSTAPPSPPVLCPYSWFHTSVSINTCGCANPLCFTKTPPPPGLSIFLL